VIDAVRASPLGELFRPGILVNQNAGAGNNWAKGNYTKSAAVRPERTVKVSPVLMSR
jgi:tubulin beta